MENPIKMDDLGGPPLFLGWHPYCWIGWWGPTSFSIFFEGLYHHPKGAKTIFRTNGGVPTSIFCLVKVIFVLRISGIKLTKLEDIVELIDLIASM